MAAALDKIEAGKQLIELAVARVFRPAAKSGSKMLSSAVSVESD